MEQPENLSLNMPVMVIGKSDVGRLLRELETLHDFLTQAAIREGGTAVKLPKTSRVMDEIMVINKLNGLVEKDRIKLLAFLRAVHAKAPVMHFSFCADPSPAFMKQLMTWLRRTIHPLVLVQVGLQPSIGAGCIVRTANKQFDFSLKERFAAQRGLLIQQLSGAPDG